MDLRGEADPRRVPLCLIAVVLDADPTRLEAHFSRRMPLLPNGKKAVYLDEGLIRLRNFDTAREFALAYLDQFWFVGGGSRPDEDPLWPYREEGIKALHSRWTDASLGPILLSAGSWMEVLHRAWNLLVRSGDGKPFQERWDAWIAEIGGSPGSLATERGGGRQEPPPGQEILRDPSLRRAFERYLRSMTDPQDLSSALAEHIEDALAELGSKLQLPITVTPRDRDIRAPSLHVDAFSVWALIAISAKSNQGGGCKSDWDRFADYYKKLRRRKSTPRVDRLVFLRTEQQRFPMGIPEQVAGVPVVTHELSREDYQLVFGALYLSGRWTPDPGISLATDPGFDRAGGELRRTVESDSTFLAGLRSAQSNLA